MSTERPHRRRSFVLTLVAVLGALALVAVALIAIEFGIPPRLTGASVSATAVVAQPGQRLTLTLDQPASAVGAADVSIDPAAPIDVTANGTTIDIAFPGMLAYGQHYRVSVGVRSAATGAHGQVETEFDTPPAVILTHIAGDPTATPPKPDALVRTVFRSGTPDRTTVYTAQQITEFAEVGDRYAVISDEGDGLRPRFVAPDGTSTAIAGPDGAYYGDLHANPDGTGFGYVVSGGAPGPDGVVADSQLMLVDGAGDPTVVPGADGKPLSVLAWRYLPGTGKLAVEDYGELTYVVDPNGTTAPAPFGAIGQLIGVLAGSETIVNDSYPNLVLTDLTNGKSTTLAEDTLTDDPAESPGVVTAVAPGAVLQALERYDASTFPPTITSRVVLRDADGLRELFRAAAGTYILSMCLAPNGHVAAIQAIDSGGASSTTTVVDLDSGRSLGTAPGDSTDWCR